MCGTEVLGNVKLSSGGSSSGKQQHGRQYASKPSHTAVTARCAALVISLFGGGGMLGRRPRMRSFGVPPL